MNKPFTGLLRKHSLENCFEQKKKKKRRRLWVKEPFIYKNGSAKKWYWYKLTPLQVEILLGDKFT